MGTPWYRRVRRWGQTNLTEIDTAVYDPSFWRSHWRRTGTEGVIVNAGGIVAYYPSDVPFHYRAEGLGDRDLFGEIVSEARASDLAVLARMDCNRATEKLYRAHPDWFVTRADGSPLVTQERYVACVNSPYYKEHIPQILKEIIERYHPDGFTDNSWTGSSVICRCGYCAAGFRADCDADLPNQPDWDDPTYRRWVQWSYRRREANWDLFNEVTAAAGGRDCLWVGMVNANPFHSHLRFTDLRAVGRRAAILMCDHQSRDELNGFEQNAVNGALLHSVTSPETIIPESMAHYVRGVQAFRRASMPEEETRTWMRCGFAGGISPWWHHVGSAQEDRRQFDTSVDLLHWHRRVEEHLTDRRSCARVGLVWSHENVDFYGRDSVIERSALPWRGTTAALTRSRTLFTPIHAEDIPSDPATLQALVFPDVAVLSDESVARIRAFHAAGGSIVLTGRSGTMAADGSERTAWPFADIVGYAPTGDAHGSGGTSSWEDRRGHSYLRLREGDPLRLCDAFGDTVILPFGGTVTEYRPAGRAGGAEPARIIATLVPSFPIYPPEFAWMRTPETDIPAVIARDRSATGGRVVLFAGDVDRQYGRTRLPDLGRLLSHTIDWAAGTSDLEVSGPGYLSCWMYRKGEQTIVHMVNLTGLNQWPGYAEELFPVGPLRLSIAVGDARPSYVESAVTGERYALSLDEGPAPRAVTEIPMIVDHEVLVLR